MRTLNKGVFWYREHWLLLAMLVSLHGALLLGIESLWTHPLLLAHFGLFLLWQPLWSGERKIGYGALVFILLAVLVVLFWINWWVAAFWLIGLFGLVGSRILIFRSRWMRLRYLLAMVYLLAVLLTWVVPNVFAVHSTLEVGSILMWYVLPLLQLTMLMLPVEQEPGKGAQTVDVIYSILLFMLLMLVMLGSFAFMTLGRLDYLDALLRTLFTIAFILLAFGILWNPRFGFSGLRVMFSRYLLNVGTPFEEWLAQLTHAAQREPDVAAYLRRAVTLLGDLPWLSGLSWQAPEGSGQLGQFSDHAVVVQEGGLRLTLYARQPLHSSLLLHIHLLVQLISYFYHAKHRELSLRDIVRLQAVYQTGSRLTHDLKNMLQSLLTLASAAQSSDARALQLLQQQLPLLTQRIEMALHKLQQPQVEDDATQLALNVWWDNLCQRNQHLPVQWQATDPLPGKNVPAALFDCIVDNLLDNALRKRQSHPATTVVVAISGEPLCLTVCDSGEPVPDNIGASLLRGVVVSQHGLGIGLYQAARWAEQLGYQLRLSSNRAGKVCFELRGNEGGQRRRNL